MAQEQLRVLSWNLHGLRDDVRALIRIVRDADPDVMCVQEAPKYLRWRSKCAALARRCGLLYVTGGGTTGGSVLLAGLRVDVRAAEEVCLSRQWGWPARGVAAAEIRKGDARLAVASIHLPLEERERMEHARRVLAVRRTLSAPYALAAGDINERPGGPAWHALAGGGLRDLDPKGADTYPSVGPRKRIDGVLGSDGVEVVDVRVIGGALVERASDHRPLVATVTVPAG